MIDNLPNDYKFTAEQEKMIEEIGLLRFRRRSVEIQKSEGKTPHEREQAVKTLINYNKAETLLMAKLEKSIKESLSAPTEDTGTETP